jgi:hypothetical protein
MIEVGKHCKALLLRFEPRLRVKITYPTTFQGHRPVLGDLKFGKSIIVPNSWQSFSANARLRRLQMKV